MPEDTAPPLPRNSEASANTAVSEKLRRDLAFENAALLETVAANDFERAVEQFNRIFLLPWNSPAEELVSRACSLAFHLQISGGLLTAQPMNVLSKAVIDPEGALHGFFRRALNEKSAGQKKGKKAAHSGPRQFLYAEGRIQSLSNPARGGNC